MRRETKVGEGNRDKQQGERSREGVGEVEREREVGESDRDKQQWRRERGGRGRENLVKESLLTGFEDGVCKAATQESRTVELPGGDRPLRWSILPWSKKVRFQKGAKEQDSPSDPYKISPFPNHHRSHNLFAYPRRPPWPDEENYPVLCSLTIHLQILQKFNKRESTWRRLPNIWSKKEEIYFEVR